MQFLVVFTPKHGSANGGPPTDLPQVEQAEQVQAKALYKVGAVRQIWAIATPEKGAVGLFEASSETELQSMVETFPMVQKGYADHQAFPLAPFEPFAA